MLNRGNFEEPVPAPVPGGFLALMAWGPVRVPLSSHADGLDFVYTNEPEDDPDLAIFATYAARMPVTEAPRSGAGIMTTGGGWIPTFGGLPQPFCLGSTTTWQVTGQTLDSAGSPLPSCRVLVLEWGRLVVGQSPVIADVMSSAVDGSFAIPVPGNGDYQAIAYKPGSPDVAGITLHPLTPTLAP